MLTGPPATPGPAEPDAGTPRERETPAVTLYDRVWASGLPNAAAIARRELSGYFISPIGYVVGAVLALMIAGIGFIGPVGLGQPINFGQQVLALASFLMVFVTPLYTMRLLAEERRSGTLEMMLTSPVRDWEVVVGKWLGCLVFYLATLASTLVLLAFIVALTPTRVGVHVFGHTLSVPNLDYGSILTAYIGVVLVGSAWVAIGLLASSLTSNQIIAAILGIGLLLGLDYVLGVLSHVVIAPYGSLLDYLNATNRAASFNEGRLVLSDFVYFLTLSAAALFLTTRVLESRKWR